MSKSLSIAAALLALVAGCHAPGDFAPESGDIVFHTSKSEQSRAIQEATHSPFSHMGIVVIRNGEAWVFEAIQPVQTTPWNEWIARGEGGRYVVKRLIRANEVLTADALERMLEVGEEFSGRPYDFYFEWSDERIYCSELVWKIYERALGIEIGALQELGEFDLSSPAVRQKLEERWGGEPPRRERVISPASMFESHELVEVYRRD